MRRGETSSPCLPGSTIFTRCWLPEARIHDLRRLDHHIHPFAPAVQDLDVGAALGRREEVDNHLADHQVGLAAGVAATAIGGSRRAGAISRFRCIVRRGPWEFLRPGRAQAGAVGPGLPADYDMGVKGALTMIAKPASALARTAAVPCSGKFVQEISATGA